MRRVLAPLLIGLAASAIAAEAASENGGIRIGMSPAEVEAAGFALRQIVSHETGAIGYVLDTEQFPCVRRSIAFFLHEALFELWVTYKPMPHEAAQALTRDLYATFEPPQGTGDAMRVAVRWIRRGVIIRYSVEPYDEGRYAPSLLLQDEAEYLEAREFFGQIDYSHVSVPRKPAHPPSAIGQNLAPTLNISALEVACSTLNPAISPSP